MTRALRLEFPGALYHLTARGNERQKIYRDDHDHKRFLRILAREIAQQRWRCHAYCLMGNHFHLLVETPEPNLAIGMRRLNSSYSQSFNRRFQRVGHLFQGRYHAVLVEKESYLLHVARYVVLNPVRAALVERPEDWAWSSYRATAGLAPEPEFLQTRWLLARYSECLETARSEYRRFVHAQMVECPWDEAKGGVWLGSESFRAKMKERLECRPLPETPSAQRDPLRPTAEQILQGVLQVFCVTESQLWARECQPAFQAAIYLLRRVGNLPLKEVAALSGVSCARISTIQRRIESGHRPDGIQELLNTY